jgi:hypothetical protein
MTTRKELREQREQKVCDKFNEAHPVGTKVRYWKKEREGEPSGVAQTRSMAQVLSGHTAVVWVVGEPGCIAMSHVQAVDS